VRPAAAYAQAHRLGLLRNGGPDTSAYDNGIFYVIPKYVDSTVI